MYLGGKNIRRFLAFALSISVVATGVLLLANRPVSAVTGINEQINFQGRLFNGQGAVVPDGYYNIQFKIYQDGDGQSVGNTTGSPAGTLEWTESHLNANSQGVLVQNGYMSVELGSLTAFGSSVDWNQSVLWLSMNIGSTNGSCTPFTSCSPDGEMIPMKRMSAVPYALNAKNANQLGGLASSQFVQLAQGVQTDASTNTTSIYLNKTAGGNFLQLQSSGVDVFTVANAGDLTLGSNANKTITVATSAASTAGRSLTIGAGIGGSGTGSAGGDLVLQGGAAGGTDANGGNVSLNAGAKTGTGTDGTISIGTSNTSSLSLGASGVTTTNNGALTVTQATTLNGGLTAANTGNVAFQRNTTDITTTGTLTDLAIGTGALFRFNGASAQTLSSIASPADGRIVTIINAAATTLTIQNDTGGTAANRIITGTGTDVSILTGASVTLTYDSSASRWRVIGATASGGSSANQQLSNLSGTVAVNLDLNPGSDNTLDIGSSSFSWRSLYADTSVLTPNLDVASAGALGIGNTTATSVSLCNSAACDSISIGTNADADTITLGDSTDTIGITGSTTVLGTTLINTSGTANTTIGSSAATTTSIQGGSGVNIGTDNVANTIQIGSTTLSSGTQTINIGNNNTAGGTTNVTIGSGSGAAGGTTTLQAKTSIAISTDGVARASFDNAGSVYFGNGVTAGAPSNFTVSGTGSSTTAVAGGTLTVQGGNATVGNANGGNLTLSGGTGAGTGVNGLVVLTTPTFSTTANDANCYTGGSLVASSCTITQTTVNNSAAVLVGFSVIGQTATLPDPTTATAGRVIYVTAANGSSEFTLSVNGGGQSNQIAMRQNTTATMIWNGSDWTAAGASSSTTLQAAYDNTLTSAGGAELILSNGSNANGLTIRDSSTNPVNGTLLEVQNSSAANLLSVNSNVTEYTSNSGAETAGGSSTTFPSNTWSALGASTVARYITAGTYVATGQASASVATTGAASDGVKNTLNTSLTANQHYNVSFSAKLASGTFTDMAVYYSIDGSANSVTCATGQAVKTKVWTKINCTFTAPSSGITSSNSINIRQIAGTARTLYVDNISVTIAADYNYATDGTVNNAANFTTNWTAVGSSSVSRITSDGQEASDSAQIVAGTTAGNGIKNLLSINPLASTLYRVSVYAKLSSGSAFSDFTVRYTPNNGTNFVDCVDYNTQTVVTTGWTQITCYIETASTTVTSPYVHFVQTAAPGVARTYLVDDFSMTLSSASTPNVQIGGGSIGGPTTLFTLDRAASAPIAENNDALLGSMYYDTTLGKLQCYEADGWGACGSSPDNIVTLSPEYTNAVMHGTGIGTMNSDICSDDLNINDGSSSQPTICGNDETYNFYKWTSPQSSDQTYSIYVTYQLPATFKDFASGDTSLMGRTDSANSTVNYQVYRNNTTTGLTACGGTVAVSTGSQSSWQTGSATGAADPSTCGFAASDSIVFKINVTARSNANAYVGNLNFTFANR